MTVVVDANCFKGYVDCIISQVENIYQLAFERIFSSRHIALDEGGLIGQEWRECTGGFSNIFVGDLIAGWEAEGKVVYLKYERDANAAKRLRELGVPKNDARLILFALGQGIVYILSDDIDLFEPARKGCTHNQHQHLVLNRNGSVCRFVEKEWGICIFCVDCADDYL
jgi:hypothetical protein